MKPHLQPRAVVCGHAAPIGAMWCRACTDAQRAAERQREREARQRLARAIGFADLEPEAGRPLH